MAVCPLCNSLKELKVSCSNCKISMEDSGKVSDFLDPYGHYNDEETVKMGDGYPNTARDEICPHLFTCKECGSDEIKFVQEE